MRVDGKFEALHLLLICRALRVPLLILGIPFSDRNLKKMLTSYEEEEKKKEKEEKRGGEKKKKGANLCGMEESEEAEARSVSSSMLIRDSKNHQIKVGSFIYCISENEKEIDLLHCD